MASVVSFNPAVRITKNTWIDALLSDCPSASPHSLEFSSAAIPSNLLVGDTILWAGTAHSIWKRIILPNADYTRTHEVVYLAWNHGSGSKDG